MGSNDVRHEIDAVEVLTGSLADRQWASNASVVVAESGLEVLRPEETTVTRHHPATSQPLGFVNTVVTT